MKLFALSAIFLQAQVAARDWCPNCSCPPGWELVGKRKVWWCYRFFDEEKNKPDAKEDCWSRNHSELAHVEKGWQAKALKKKLNSKAESFWLRINDHKEEGKWVVD